MAQMQEARNTNIESVAFFEQLQNILNLKPVEKEGIPVLVIGSSDSDKIEISKFLSNNIQYNDPSDSLSKYLYAAQVNKTTINLWNFPDYNYVDPAQEVLGLHCNAKALELHEKVKVLCVIPESSLSEKAEEFLEYFNLMSQLFTENISNDHFVFVMSKATVYNSSDLAKHLKNQIKGKDLLADEAFLDIFIHHAEQDKVVFFDKNNTPVRRTQENILNSIVKSQSVENMNQAMSSKTNLRLSEELNELDDSITATIQRHCDKDFDAADDKNMLDEYRKKLGGEISIETLSVIFKDYASDEIFKTLEKQFDRLKILANFIDTKIIQRLLNSYKHTVLDKITALNAKKLEKIRKEINEMKKDLQKILGKNTEQEEQLNKICSETNQLNTETNQAISSFPEPQIPQKQNSTWPYYFASQTIGAACGTAIITPAIFSVAPYLAPIYATMLAGGIFGLSTAGLWKIGKNRTIASSLALSIIETGLFVGTTYLCFEFITPELITAGLDIDATAAIVACSICVIAMGANALLWSMTDNLQPLTTQNLK